MMWLNIYILCSIYHYKLQIEDCTMPMVDQFEQEMLTWLVRVRIGILIFLHSDYNNEGWTRTDLFILHRVRVCVGSSTNQFSKAVPGDCQVPSSLITSSHNFSDISLPITLALSYGLWLLKHFCGVNIRCRDEPLRHGVEVRGVQPPHPRPPVTLVSLYQPQVFTLLQRYASLRWGWNSQIS